MIEVIIMNLYISILVLNEILSPEMWTILRMVSFMLFGFGSFMLGDLKNANDRRILTNKLALQKALTDFHTKKEGKISQFQWYTIKNANCGTCKFNKQGPTCVFCSNPEQQDENLKNYVYHNVSCYLWEYKEPNDIKDEQIKN